MTSIVARILLNTGYRFPKYGLFGRDCRGRRLLKLVGINCVRCNLAADSLHMSLER
jgi:hypothetical protein